MEWIMTDNDLKTDDLIETFTSTLRMLTPRNRDIFVRKLMEAAENARKLQMEEEIAQENANEFIQGIQEETQALQSQIETEQLLETLQDEVKDLQAQETTLSNAPESNQIDSAMQDNSQDNAIESNNTQDSMEQAPLEPAQEIGLNEPSKKPSTYEELLEQVDSITPESKTTDSSQTQQASVEFEQDKEFEQMLEKDGFIPYEQYVTTLSFQEKVQEAIDDFIAQHEKELLELGIISKSPDIPNSMLYDSEIIMPKDTLESIEVEFRRDPSGFTPTISFDEVKARRLEHNNFSEICLSEITESMQRESSNKSLDEVKKLNPDSYFSDITDWFKKKQIENMNMPMSKDTFKREFYEYCKNGMSENEMKILLILDNKEPTKLTKEHKDMIKEGLKLCGANTKLLDKGLESAIKASVGEKLTNANALEFGKTLEKAKDSKNPIDKKFIDSPTSSKLLETIKVATPKLTPENAKKLDDSLALAQGKTITQSQSMGRTR